MRSSFLLGAIVALLLVTLARAASSEKQLGLLHGINEFRSSANLPIVYVNPILMRVAQRRAEEMAEAGKLSLESASGKNIEEELKEEGYPVNRWTLDVIGGAKKEKGALEGLKEEDQSRGHLFDHFVTEAGVGFSKGRWAVILASRKNECGNGVVERDEECDDGNNLDGDCCSSDCVVDTSSGCKCSVPDELHPASVCTSNGAVLTN